jgi:hypothetical protein
MGATSHGNFGGGVAHVDARVQAGFADELGLKCVARALREQGTHRLVATVLAANDRMLALAQELGFVSSRPVHLDGTKAIHLMLQANVVGAGNPDRP